MPRRQATRAVTIVNRAAVGRPALLRSTRAKRDHAVEGTTPMKLAYRFRDAIRSLAVGVVGVVAWRAPLLSAARPDLRMAQIFLMSLGVMWMLAGGKDLLKRTRWAESVLCGSFVLVPAVYQGMAAWTTSGRVGDLPLVTVLTLYRAAPALCAAALVGLALRWNGLFRRDGES